MRTRFIAALVLLAAASSPRAQEASLPDHVRAAADRITVAQITRDLDFLSSDALLGRATPSPGFDTAANYIADRLTAAGLKPAGDDGTFFQHYTMRESTVDSAASYVEVGGSQLPLGDGVSIVTFAGPLIGTYKAVYVGHGWTVPGKNIDPYGGVDVRGKIVLAHAPGAMPKGVEIPSLGRITPGASSVVVEAERRGAAAVVYIGADMASSVPGQPRTGQSIRRRELEPSVPSAYAAPRVTVLTLSRDGANTLLAGEAGGSDAIAKGQAQDYPASFELAKPVTVAIATATSVTHRPFNVVAILEGTDPALKAEHITVFSHLDGAVGSRTIGGDAIYNSADDNASGSAGTLSIAEQMAKAPPKRSIIFVWDSGEEVGLWGTRFFVANSPVPLDRIVTHFNIDMIGANRAPGSADANEARVTGPNEVFLIGPGVLSARADALLTRVNSLYLKLGFNRQDDRGDSSFFYPRTDAGPFLERGILTIGFNTGIHDRYHQPSDEARHLDTGKVTAIARTVFVSVWMLADAQERPGIDKPIPPNVPRYR
ncbi:MAG: M28 family peptidase [Acidobacteriota bacterium]|nr:M28 family peptidase [Acidobacteriota bacterium]